MQTERYHYMDNLRASAMLLGVVFHAMLAYVPNMQNFWLSASADNSVGLEIVAWFTHMFRMPLFFLIAGFFACYLVQKRNIGGFLKNRSMRILLPLVIFLPFVWMSVALMIPWALENIENKSPMLGMIAWFAANPEMAPETPFSTVHLWFLWNLYFFVLVYAVLQKFGARLSGIADKVLTPKVIVFLLPLVLVPSMASQMQPHPAPEQALPQWWSFGYYGVFFLLGSYYYRKPELLDQLKPYTWLMLVVGVVAYGLVYTFIPKGLTFEEAFALMAGHQITPRELGIGVLEAYSSLYLTLVCLIAGKAFLNQHSKTVRYIADSSYWVYLMHLPTLFFIQYLLLDIEWNMWVELGVSTVGTFGLGLLTYALFIRWTPIGWMLNGRKKREKSPESGTQTPAMST